MISYIGVLLIPLLMCLLSYQVAFNTVKEDIKQSNLLMLNRSKNNIDEQMRLLDSLIMQTVNNQTILSIAAQDLSTGGEFYSNAQGAISSFAHIFRYAPTNLVNNVYIYLHKSNYVMTRYELYAADFYYESILHKTEGFEQWTSRLVDRDQYSKYVVLPDQIEYAQMLPFTINKPINGSVICVISKNSLSSYFEDVLHNNQNQIIIRDNQGEVIYSANQQITDLPEMPQEESNESVFTQVIDGQKNMIINVKSQVNDWRYTLILPEDQVMGKLIRLKTTIFAIFGMALLLGVSFSYFMARRSGKPIEDVKRRLYKFFSEEGVEVDNMSATSTLSGTLDMVISKTQLLKNEIEKQKPYLEVVLLQKLIKGEFCNYQEIQSICDRTDVDLSAKAYLVASIKVFVNNDKTYSDKQTLQEVNILTVVIKDLMRKALMEQVYFYDVDQLTVTMIIPKNKVTEDQLRETLEIISSEIAKEYKVKPFWGIGNECNDLLELWRAYEQSREQLKLVISKQGHPVPQESVEQEKSFSYYYPIVFEKQLLTCTKEGNGEGIEKLVDILYTENFQKRSLNETAIEKLYLEMNSTLFKLIKNNSEIIDIEDLKEKIQYKEGQDIKKSFVLIKETYIQVAKKFKQVKKTQQDKLIHHIMNYIKEVYPDSNLGLGMVATHFNISEGYVSSLFKEQAGINFTDYVENQRIEKACELLKETDININEIGEKVGYNSVQSFRRAFKRLHGISPSEMRKSGKSSSGLRGDIE